MTKIVRKLFLFGIMFIAGLSLLGCEGYERNKQKKAAEELLSNTQGELEKTKQQLSDLDVEIIEITGNIDEHSRNLLQAKDRFREGRYGYESEWYRLENITFNLSQGGTISVFYKGTFTHFVDEVVESIRADIQFYSDAIGYHTVSTQFKIGQSGMQPNEANEIIIKLYEADVMAKPDARYPLIDQSIVNTKQDKVFIKPTAYRTLDRKWISVSEGFSQEDNFTYLNDVLADYESQLQIAISDKQALQDSISALETTITNTRDELSRLNQNTD